LPLRKRELCFVMPSRSAALKPRDL
jgi:hypothetical protein